MYTGLNLPTTLSIPLRMSPLTILLLVASLALTGHTLAQDNAQLDLDPPVVDHIVQEQGVAGEQQRIQVVATDSRGVASVTLYYRTTDALPYMSAAMSADHGQTATLYSVSVPTDVDDTQLFYYFEVIDTGGNRVLNALPFSPHVRELGHESLSSVNAETAGNDSLFESITSNKRTWIGAVGGAIIVGLLLQQNRKNESSNPAGSGDSTTVPVVLQIPLP